MTVDKAAFRLRLRGRAPATSDESRRVVENLLELPEIAAPVWIVYRAVSDGEVDLHPLVEHGAREGKRLFWPTGTVANARFVEAPPDGPWRRSSGGFDEPAEGREAEPGAFADGVTVFVPGVAFDPSGTRLGRGGGWYDRALARLRDHATPVVAGVATESRIVDGIPRERHDVPMDLVVTDRHVYRT